MTTIADELAAAAAELITALDATHETCTSTDVHHQGGIAGQAITPHCHWQCRVVGAHDDTIARVADARRHVKDLIGRVLEPAPPEVPFPQFRVQATRPATYASEPLSFADALRALPLYQFNDRSRMLHFQIATRETADDNWQPLSEAEISDRRSAAGAIQR